MFPIGVGDTSVITGIRLRDQTTGFPITGLAYNSAGAFASYTRPKQAPVAITLATQTPTGDWTSGGFCEEDAAIAPGLYRFDLPNGVAAIGAEWAFVTVGFSGVIAETVLILLDPMPDVPTGLVAADAGNTATRFKTTLSSNTDDFYKSLWVLFRSSALADQAKQIIGYEGTTKFVTVVEPFTGIPADNAQIVIVNR